MSCGAETNLPRSWWELPSSRLAFVWNVTLIGRGVLATPAQGLRGCGKSSQLSNVLVHATGQIVALAEFASSVP